MINHNSEYSIKVRLCIGDNILVCTRTSSFVGGAGSLAWFQTKKVTVFRNLITYFSIQEGLKAFCYVQDKDAKVALIAIENPC